MKKSLLVLSALALGASLNVNAQVQRISLFEEFTGENCNPCAQTNPGITALADLNYAGPKKMILLRYQVPIPSAPSSPTSLYQQNSAEPNARQDFYYPSSSDQFAPQGRFNGRELGVGQQSQGHAGYLDQPTIDGDYVVDAPFSLTTTYAWNANYDGMDITTTVTAAQNFSTANPLVLRLAIIEEHIHYATAPGSNGEKDFEFIMRKMVPDVNGQSLAGTWTNGQTQTFTNTVTLPSYIWNKGEVAIVAFIQEDVPNPGPNTIRTVHQAAYGAPQPLALDATATLLAGISASQCSPNFTPSVTIKNAGSTALTSCTINYKIDNGTVMTQPWTGNLSTGSTDVVTLPMQTATAGTHTFTAYTSAPNGSTDNNAQNDSKSQTFIIYGAPSMAPITQPFSTVGIPAGYSVYNPDGGYTWARVTSAGGTLKYDAYNNGNDGDIDHFYLPRLDFTGMTAMEIRFDVAYRQYSAAYEEQLDMLVSTDCGTTWTNLYSKAGPTLATGAAQTTAYTPTTAASNWRNETVSLSSYDGMSDVLIDFRVTNEYGNNLYLDNINVVSNPVGIKETNTLSNVSVYPNPASTNATVKVNSANTGTATITVYNALGQQVSMTSEKIVSGVNTFDLNTAVLANGLYTISVATENGKTVQKLTVSH
jgi:hypothetical protein